MIKRVISLLSIFLTLTIGSVSITFAQLDTDGDGIFDDGDNSGIAGDNPCTGGSTTNCDDNCINAYNPDQADSDGDPHARGTGAFLLQPQLQSVRTRYPGIRPCRRRVSRGSSCGGNPRGIRGDDPGRGRVGAGTRMGTYEEPESGDPRQESSRGRPARASAGHDPGTESR